MDSIIFYQPPSTRSTPPRGGSLRSGNACTSKSASETSQRNEFKDILSNVLNDHDLIEVRDITALDLGESDLPLHHASKDDENSCANCENNDNDQDFPSVEEILWRGVSNNASPSPEGTPKRLDREIRSGDSQDEPIVLDDLNDTGLESECGRYNVSRADVEVDPPFSPETYPKLVITSNSRSSDLLSEFEAFNDNDGKKDIKNNTCSLSPEQRRSQFNTFTSNTSFTSSTSISNLSSSTGYSYLNGLSSKLGEQTCEGNGGGYEHLSSDFPDLEDKEDLWDGMRVQAEVKEGDPNNDGDKDNTPPKLLDSEVRNEDNLIVIHDTDDEENNTDTNDNCHPSSKKHKRLAATPKTSSAAPKFRYPPGWVRKHRDECANPDWGEAVGSQDNSCIVQDNDIDISDDGTGKEQDRGQASLSTPPTSVTGSATGCSTLHEKKVGSASNISPSRRNILLSSADEKKKNERDDKETDANDEESESDADKYKTPLPRSTKKRSLPFVEEKLRVKRRIKRRHFSSRLSSDEQTETGDESDISSYTPIKPHHRLNLSSSFHSTDFDEDASDDAMKCKDEQPNELLISRTAVVYEQQRWEGKIVDERDAKQGRGRPRKEYRVHWEDSWINSARLTAPGLIQDWREKKAAKLRR